MEVIKIGNKLNKKIFEWECNRCGSILKAMEDDPAIEWDTDSGRKRHSGDFHYVCPQCNRRQFASTDFRSLKITREES